MTTQFLKMVLQTTENCVFEDIQYKIRLSQTKLTKFLFRNVAFILLSNECPTKN